MFIYFIIGFLINIIWLTICYIQVKDVLWTSIMTATTSTIVAALVGIIIGSIITILAWPAVLIFSGLFRIVMWCKR